MVAKRIIPCLDVKNGKVVKGVQFVNLKIEGDPANLATIYEKQGAGNLEHIYEVLTAGKADATLAASIFHRSQYSVGEVKKYLAKKGVPVRLA